ncbi:MAG: hypothetical protein JXR83_05405 [Deltaproteobacteria bacterium]|nr:hypothetical protein [Deltaproteobacteria bacterium]
MLARSWPLLLCATLLGCPEPEPEADCRSFSCGEDAYCDPVTYQCRKDIVFADSQLEQCLREEIGISEGSLLVSDVPYVISLECPDRQIASLEGLQHFTALESLALWENEIVDLTPLGSLTGLTSLQLGNNAISDVWPIEPLIYLRRLGLAYNQIEDIGALGNLWDLEWLNLDENLVADVSPLWDLTLLNWLTIERNPIADLTPIEDLQIHGCEVYKRRDGEVGDERRPGAGSLPPVERELFERSRLSYELAEDGALSLRYRGRDRVHPVRHEFVGELRLSDTAVVYRRGGCEFVVGAVLAPGIELCRGEFEAVCQLAIGVKWPDASDLARWPATAGAPVYSANLVLRGPDGGLGGRFAFKGEASSNQVLDPFVLASPNQGDSGSCVFMAVTGAMEVLMNQHLAPEAIAYKGDSDLSERYLMNVGNRVSGNSVRSSITDLVYYYREAGGSLLDRDYSYVYAPDGQYLSAQINWTDQMPANWRDLLVATPGAERTMIYRTPRGDDGIWDVGLMNDDMLERIKYEIRTMHAPVIVVYNHYLYWHAVMIIGYDDNDTVGGCPFVGSSISYFDDNGASDYANKIRRQMEAQGGCRGSGVFYVRDSIYDGGSDEPMYNYGSGYTDRYSDRVIMHEYEWVKYLGNHAYSMHRN